MKKILFIFLVCLLIGFAYLGVYYYKQSRISQREIDAMTAMRTRFADFVSNWELARVPALFVDNVQIKQVAKSLVEAKQRMGKCSLSTISPCVAGERSPENDEYVSQYGHSISCPFTLSCEKEKDIQGVCIFFVIDNIVKLYKFGLKSADVE